mgnify:CR=1 FL=1
MKKFQIISDTHIEFLNEIDINDFIIPEADYLILAGDIGSIYKLTQLKKFLIDLSNLFKYIIYIPGNNEYYNIDTIEKKSFSQLNDILNNLNISNLKILNRNHIIIDDICIIGCILWSFIKKKLPNDLIKIHDITIQKYNQMHIKDVYYIQNCLNFYKNSKLKFLVITHYPPIPIKKQRKNDNLSCFYKNELQHLIKNNNIHTWVCGHIHYNFDFYMKNTRIIGNQKGKRKSKC